VGGVALVARARVLSASLCLAGLLACVTAGGGEAATVQDPVFGQMASPLPDVPLAAAAAVPSGFEETVVMSGLEQPMAFRFAPDGRVFIAEKGGEIEVFDSLSDPTPTHYADLSTRVHDTWDRGLMGLALDPQFTTGRPFVYALYSHDADIGGTAPKWGDDCPTPPGPTADGCVISGRLSKLSGGAEQVLIEDWCQQYMSHSVGTVAFGADGALYAGAGDGASFDFPDIGADGNPVNPCGDAPAPVGGSMTPPTAEGGALRSQDLRTSGDPATLDGSIIRVNPDTGAAMPDNPNVASSDPNVRRIIAYGLRNPFRFTIRPGTNEILLGDVGWNDYEEINHLPSPAAPVENFGWPCYEGSGRHPSYDGLNLSICENLYAAGAGAVTPPLYAYHHSAKVSTESCPTGGSSISGAEIYDGGTFPAQYNGALFWADYSRNCIWVMFPGGNGAPDPATRQPFVTDAVGPVDLQVGPGGSLYYADINTGTIRRIRALVTNNAPNAVAGATPTSGPVPLEVDFDGTDSSDPEGAALTFAWDLDGDGAFDDSTSAQPTFTYTASGTYTVRLRVTDPSGLTDTDQLTITAGSPPTPTIETPAAGTTWKTGDVISFTGSATRAQGGSVPASGLTWALVLQHCSALVPSSCHDHTVQSFNGASGSFTAPSHDYPAYLELKLTATDGGLSSTVTRRLDPKTVALTFETQPAGLELNVGTESESTPFTRTAIQGSNVSLIAPSPQPQAGKTYEFSSWSDGGAAAHVIQAPTTPATYRANYSEVVCAPLQGLAGAWGFDEPSGAGVTDASGLANNGSITGATRTTSGRFGSALTFDGLDDLVTVPDSTSLDLTTRATLEAWVYPTALGGSWRTALLKEQAGQLVYALYANDDFGRPAGHLFTTGDLRAGGTSSLPLNTWSHLALTWDGTTERFYVNGVQVGTAAVAGTLVNGAGPLRFGGNGVWSEWFAGRLDEIRVYNRALTQAELQADMSTPVTCVGSPPPQPALSTSASSLSFNGTQGGANPAVQTFNVTNTGGGTLNWTASESASWLTVTPASGTAPSTLTASVSTAGLAPGTYTAPITVTAAGATGSPKTVNVTLVVSAAPPVLTVSPSSLSFTATQGGANPAAQTVNVTNGGGGTLSWTASDNQPWLSVALASGTGAGTPSVSANIAGLAAGTYTGTVTISAAGASGSPKTVAVTLTVNPPTPVLAVSPASLTFNATAGGGSPAAQTVNVTNTGGGTLSWAASDNQPWLSTSPATGTAPGTVSVSANTSGLAAGTYTGTVTISAAGASGSPKTVAVTLNVSPAAPVLSVTPGSLVFAATQGGANPAPQMLNVSNTGGGTLSWTASDDQSWLAAAPASGTAPGTVSVSVNTAGLAPGTYGGTVTVAAGGASGSPKAIGVILVVNSPPAGGGPVGAWGFDETSGTAVTDASGRGNNGTIAGAVRTTAGRIGSALSFDGVNDWVTVPDAPSLDLTNRATLEAWVYPTALGSTWRTALLKEQPGQLVYALYANNDLTRPSGHVFTTGDLFSNGGAALALNTWSHLALTWDGTTLRLWLNGNQVATRALTGTMPNSSLPLRFGGNGVWSEWFAGRLDEVRVYDRALTQSELQADMTRPISGTGLAAASRAARSRSAREARTIARKHALRAARRRAHRLRAHHHGRRRVTWRAVRNPGARPDYSGITVHTAK
jgi:glucose/arabinose dehydrogenase/PKD repeat protein